MGKPLLTDELLEKVARGEDWHTDYPHDAGDQASVDTLDVMSEDQSVDHVVKSRQMEQAKRGAFKAKLNLILFVLVVILAVVVYAVFNW